MDMCPCDSGRPYTACCEPFHRNQKEAASPEEVLRSRYSAYVKNEIDYICATQAEGDRKAAEDWSKASQFIALRILKQEDGGEDRGFIDFEADYLTKGEKHTHREHSTFERRGGRWIFVKGQGITQVSKDPKVGRNDPCPCGSGKKFKKCCG